MKKINKYARRAWLYDINDPLLKDHTVKEIRKRRMKNELCQIEIFPEDFENTNGVNHMFHGKYQNTERT